MFRRELRLAQRRDRAARPPDRPAEAAAKPPAQGKGGLKQYRGLILLLVIAVCCSLLFLRTRSELVIVDSHFGFIGTVPLRAALSHPTGKVIAPSSGGCDE